MPTPTKGPRLGAGPTHERMILSNMSQQLFEHKRITTTVTKAKRLRPVAERLITFAKRGDLASRRRVMRQLTDKSVVHELFTSIASAMEGREGGYTRITKIGNRKGDNAPMAVIELVMEPVAKRETVAEAERATAKAAPAPAAPVDTPAGSSTADVKAEEIPAEEQAPAVGSEEAAEVAAENKDAEFPGSHAPLESGEAPEGFAVKGNRNSMKYHVPGSRWYSGTTAEIWFDSPANAEAAGFQPAGGAAAQKISE
ncbi:50S ribosomal protein L17 [Kocuria sp.]|uniref:50S ribosomal protein L17, sunset domain variant n=1 Tax=Kocuria sp. TaxID=1871328 RepID=UPI0026DB7682|nr:50S ribosomal protein L17 [Kocuria sp.]MDO4918712.1 50S ribosomal protein L17 [Kocuria sp.]